MLETSTTFLSADQQTSIHVQCWRPKGRPIGIIQIAHGMVEFIQRYDDFARFLTSRDFLVVGNDHLGHGKSIMHPDNYGHVHQAKGMLYMVQDLHTVTLEIKQQYPNTPLVLFGHSMGSFVVRKYLELYGSELQGAIICGTGMQPLPLLWGGILCTEVIRWIKGDSYRSPWVDNLAFGGYNKRFQPARTAKDWLTRDEQAVDAYLKDERTQFIFSVSAYQALFRLIKQVSSRKHAAKIPPHLPLLFIAGSDDPVGAFGKGFQQAVRLYQTAGCKAVTSHLYAGYRHELLNERGKEQLYQDIYHWLTTVTAER